MAKLNILWPYLAISSLESKLPEGRNLPDFVVVFSEFGPQYGMCMKYLLGS